MAGIEPVVGSDDECAPVGSPVSSVREVAVKKHEDQSTTVVVSEVRGPSAEEERILRMRAGASLAPDAPLGSKLEAVAPPFYADVQARLRLIEAEALAALEGMSKSSPTLDAERKSRIIDALRGAADD